MAVKKTKKKVKTGKKKATKTKITKDMMIGEVIRKYPDTAEVMMKHGMHCIGCHVALWESIEQGCLAHGMDPKTIDKMVEEMNEKV